MWIIFTDKVIETDVSVIYKQVDWIIVCYRYRSNEWITVFGITTGCMNESARKYTTHARNVK